MLIRSTAQRHGSESSSVLVLFPPILPILVAFRESCLLGDMSDCTSSHQDHHIHKEDAVILKEICLQLKASIFG